MIGEVHRYRFPWRFYSNGTEADGVFEHTKTRQMIGRRSKRIRYCCSCGNTIPVGEAHLVDSTESRYRVHTECAETVE